MITTGCLNDMFPTTWSFGLFLLYVSLFVNQGWLVTRSQEADNKYRYDTEVAVLLSECLKFIVCVVAYSFRENVSTMILEARTHCRVLTLYFVPASLYCVYNNLAYVNLSIFDPTTYFLALQLRVVATGIVFQVIFKNKLSGRQWFSLILLTCGCMVKEINFGDAPTSLPHEAQGKQLSMTLSFSSLLLLAQVMCSCLAGVYNEYLLKSNSQSMSLYLQNIFQYFDSLVCIFVFLLFEGKVLQLFAVETYTPFLNLNVLLVIVNNAAIGIVTSFFLRYLNSILKTFASGLELVFTAILSRMLFSIPVYFNTMFAIFIVTLAIIVYSQNPVNNVNSALKKNRERLIDKPDVI